jgi:secreted trypsin-like serine protease
LCAFSDKGVDACHGDSGGPVSYEQNNVYYLHGITSFGSGCGSGYPSVYTKVNRYLDWIEKEMWTFE